MPLGQLEGAMRRLVPTCTQKQIYEACMNECLRIEANHSDVLLYKNMGNTTSGGRPDAFQSPRRDRRDRNNSPTRQQGGGLSDTPSINAMQRRGGFPSPGRDWTTSPESGSQRLSGPPPEGSDARNLMEHFAREGQCSWCTEKGHRRNQCPVLPERRLGN